MDGSKGAAPSQSKFFQFHETDQNNSLAPHRMGNPGSATCSPLFQNNLILNEERKTSLDVKPMTFAILPIILWIYIVIIPVGSLIYAV